MLLQGFILFILRMKTAVLFSLVVIAIAFLNPTSAAATNRCDCVSIVAEHIEDYVEYLDLPADYHVPDYLADATPEDLAQFVCDHAPQEVLDYAAVLLDC